jgi:hypothetical protein
MALRDFVDFGLDNSKVEGVATMLTVPDEVRSRARKRVIKAPVRSSPWRTAASIRAAVEAAENWNIYVTAHACKLPATRQAVAGGVSASSTI